MMVIYTTPASYDRRFIHYIYKYILNNAAGWE